MRRGGPLRGESHPPPPVHMLKSRLPVLQGVTLCGNRVVGDARKLRRSHTKMGWALAQYVWCPHRKGTFGCDTPTGGMAHEYEGRGWGRSPQAKECHRWPATARNGERPGTNSRSQAPEEPALPRPLLGLVAPGLPDGRRLLCKVPGVWYRHCSPSRPTPDREKSWLTSSRGERVPDLSLLWTVGLWT